MSAPDLAAYFRYLDNLNRLAITNMSRAAFYLESRFMIDCVEADQILQEWINRFVPTSTPSRRANASETCQGATQATEH